MDRRDGTSEHLDGPLDDPRTLVGNLRDLRMLNRLSGGVGLSRWGVNRLLDGSSEVGTVIDVGTGGAELSYDADYLTIPSARVVQGRFGALRVDVAGRTARFRFQTVDGTVRDDFRLSCP